METWLSVADSAVKIGLGAVITAVVGHLATKARYRADFEKDKLGKRLDLFEQINLQVLEHRKVLARFVDVLSDYVINRDEPELEHAFLKKLEKVQQQIEDANLQMLAAHTRLVLLGERTCTDRMQEYNERVDAFYREAWNKKASIQEQEIDDLSSPSLEARDLLLEELGNVYRKLVL